MPKKYEGLDGTELAISESQERMAVDVAAEDVDEFLAYAREENLEATVIATVTEDPRMVMTWNGDKIVNLSREFRPSTALPSTRPCMSRNSSPTRTPWGEGTLAERMNKLVTDINVASNKGLSERFDSTIGAGTVLMPFGGKRQLTPNMAMVAKLPVFGETTTASAMAWGFNPYIMSKNQFTGAYLSVVESLAKLVAAGFEHEKAYLSFQEYFEKLRDEPERWGKPAAAVLGALMAQVDLGAGAIGGKDSMSGSFEDLDVPPTLISFAVAVGNMKRATSPESKDADHRIVRIAPRYLADGLTPDKDALLEVFSVIEELTDFHDALAVSTPGYGATAEALFKMTLGNRIGVTLNNSIAVDDLFTPAYGSFIVELADDAKLPAVSNLVEEWRNRHHHLRVRVQGRRRENAGPGRCAGSLGVRHRIRVPGPFQGRGQGRDRRDHRLPRAEEDRVRRLFRGQAACGDPGVPGQQLRVRFRRRLRACRRRWTH